MVGNRRNLGYGGAVIGSIFAVIGVVFLLDLAGVLAPYDVFDFWPLVLVVFGIVKLAAPLPLYSRVAGGVFVAVGALLQLGALGLVPVDTELVWGVFVVMAVLYVALVAVMRRFSGHRARGSPPVKGDDTGNTAGAKGAKGADDSPYE